MVKEDDWTNEARRVADELSPKVEAMLSDQLDVEILHWANSHEAFFTILLYDRGSPMSLTDIFLTGLGHDVLPKEWNALSCLKALHMRGWLSIDGKEYGLTPEARRIVAEVTGEGDIWKRHSALDEWMMHQPAKPVTRD